MRLLELQLTVAAVGIENLYRAWIASYFCGRATRDALAFSIPCVDEAVLVAGVHQDRHALDDRTQPAIAGLERRAVARMTGRVVYRLVRPRSFIKAAPSVAAAAESSMAANRRSDADSIF